MSLIAKKKLSLAVAMAAGLAVPGLAFATNGYFAHGYGTQTKGLAGAGVAFSQDSMAAATNPAGMVLVGDRMDIGVAAFSPIREYTASGASGPQPPPAFNLANGTVESDNELFFIPHLGYNWMLDKNNSIGVSVYGNGGMNTEYKAAKTPGGLGTYFAGTAGVDLSQLFVAGTYAHKFAPNSAVGASLIGVYQRFKATGLGSFAGFSTSASNLSNKGYDTSTGFGGKVGGQFDVGGGVAIGASYQTKMRMSEFDKYKGLFAEQGDFDIPATGTIGAAFTIMPGHTLVFDIQRIFYSDLDNSVSNPFMPNLGICQVSGGGPSGNPNCLGGSNSAGFGWEDMTVFKLGYQAKLNSAWTLRAGYSKGDQPIPSSEVLFNILAPGVMEDHFTAGFTWNMDKKNEINFAAMYAPSNKVSGPNPLAAGSQTITLEMKQYEFEISWGKKF
jgi:long-chain fatty acid transport protein